MDRSFALRNTESRERLRTLVTGLGDETLQRPLDGDWTVGAALAHLAFWDRMVESRWDQYDRDGAIDPLPDSLVAVINPAGLPQWLAVPPRRSVELALAAAEAVDRRIEGLADAAVEYALASGRLVLVNRSLHRQEHLDQIERLLTG